MKKVVSILFFCSVLILLLFLLFGKVEDWIGNQLHSQESKIRYSLLSSLFLTSDILLPVPSSLVMILNGKVLGVWAGSLVSFLSGLASSSIGYYIGKTSHPFLDRFFSEEEKVAGNRLFNRYGDTAIIMSKALPVFSEAVSLLSGTSAFSFRRFFLYSAIGHLIISLAYGLLGNYAGSLNSSMVSGLVMLSAPVIAWIVNRLMRLNSGKKPI